MLYLVEIPDHSPLIIDAESAEAIQKRFEDAWRAGRKAGNWHMAPTYQYKASGHRIHLHHSQLSKPDRTAVEVRDAKGQVIDWRATDGFDDDLMQPAFDREAISITPLEDWIAAYTCVPDTTPFVPKACLCAH